MDFSIIFDNIDLYLEGAWTTIQLVFLALLLGLFIAVPLAVLRNNRNPLIWGPIWVYTYFFRGTPMLVQVFLVYYGFGQFEAMRESFLWPFFKEAYWCALFAFTLNTAAYTTEIFRGAIANTPYGEIEAARAYGMSRGQQIRRIILPSALRRALPAYSNEVVFMLHGSAIAGIVTIVDLTGAARLINAKYYSPFEAFIAAGLFYMAITFTIVFIFRQLEKRYHAHLRPRS
ncbi:ABC transporter permease [Aestuariirhabdus litorea]|uniref:Arginine ABC transporter permease protein ArtM n=1 Tax=Aestuariirhabdus litorea TaxID=2528527 RepID=A0A3P3VMD2_9GAMM|nr:ABC transporter permease [Aestuariirhabdus litorea]RRJ83922.1 ABC transporter permease subunit [Aestuariirhabdus litorea]RWW97144.1 ABC transporter permease subunit [Endozoicomonadaceae bacterium GTF-13]